MNNEITKQIAVADLLAVMFFANQTVRLSEKKTCHQAKAVELHCWVLYMPGLK